MKQFHSCAALPPAFSFFFCIGFVSEPSWLGVGGLDAVEK